MISTVSGVMFGGGGGVAVSSSGTSTVSRIMMGGGGGLAFWSSGTSTVSKMRMGGGGGVAFWSCGTCFWFDDGGRRGRGSFFLCVVLVLDKYRLFLGPCLLLHPLGPHEKAGLTFGRLKGTPFCSCWSCPRETNR